MSSVTAKSLIDKAAIQLLDTSNVRWPRAELLGWLNDGQRQVVQLKPTSNNKISAIKLTAGSRQTIPLDGWLLMDITRNMGTDGLTPGASIRIVSRELLDGYNLSWHASTPAPVIQNYIFNLQDQTAFYTYPPSDGTNYVEINYAQVPPDVTTELLTININDIFQSALLDYILFRACSKDAEYAPGLALSKTYYDAFQAALQGKDQAELQNNPNLDLSPTNDAVRGSAT